MKNKLKRFQPIFIALLLIVVGQNLHYQWDTTQDGRYTLNENTVQLLKELKQPLKIDVFLTGQLPADYLRLQREISTLIKGMEAYTDQLIVDFIDPFEGAYDMESLIAEMTEFGLPPEYILADQNQALEQTVVFPWAMINNGDKTLRIPLLDKVLGDDEQKKINRSIAQLEFNFFDALFKITMEQKKSFAVLTSHGTSEAVKIADLMRSLQPYYQLASFDLKALEDQPEKTLENLKRFPLILISNPTQAFSETEKYILDQHLVGGGKQWWALNAVSVNRDSLFNSVGATVAVGKSLNMENAFFKYGFRLQKNLVQDLYCAPVVLASGEGSQTQYLPYPWAYYPLAQPTKKQWFGSDSGNVLMSFPSSIDTLKNDIEKAILIGSSDFSQSLQTPLKIELKEASEKLNPNAFIQPSQTLGVLLKGQFSSAYDNRVKPFDLKELQTKSPSEMIVFSSGSIAENQVEKGNPLELGYDKWTNNFYSNKTFLMESIHYLMNNKKLINIKNKRLILPRLNPEKVKNISSQLKLLLLLAPLLILLVFGGLVYRFRIRQFGQ